MGSQHFYTLPTVFNFSHNNGLNSSKHSLGSVFTCFNSSLCDGKKYSKYRHTPTIFKWKKGKVLATQSSTVNNLLTACGHSFNPMSGLKMQPLYNQIMQLIIVYSRVILHMNYILITSITCSISCSTLQRRNNFDGTKVYSNSSVSNTSVAAMVFKQSSVWSSVAAMVST